MAGRGVHLRPDTLPLGHFLPLRRYSMPLKISIIYEVMIYPGCGVHLRFDSLCLFIMAYL